MALTEMTVGKKPDEEVNDTAAEPYQFYAYSDTTKVVNLVMPFGGKETGFYRFPKVAEKILVDDDSRPDRNAIVVLLYNTENK